MTFGPMTAGFYAVTPGAPLVSREAGQHHQFMTFDFSVLFLRKRLGASDGALHPLIEAVVGTDDAALGPGDVRRLTIEQEQLIGQLRFPSVPQGARGLWYEGKVLQLMAEFFFERRRADELFCDRQKRIARERVDRVVGLLRRRLDDPPSLEEIGRAVGCSPFYLSRTFSREMGMTIPQYLRRIRIEKAAELLASGKYNVTEAALEVGYSSLSHFSQAFCQMMGCCPALYPLNKSEPKETCPKSPGFR
jgi:AraC-like DNA-binding protein